MNTFVLPDILPDYRPSSSWYYYDYRSDETNGKSRIHFTTHCVSLVLEGRKRLRSDRGVEAFSPGSVLLFTPGNYVSYEIVNEGAAAYRSVLLFFDTALIQTFLAQDGAASRGASNEAHRKHRSFAASDYLLSYADTITELLGEKHEFSPALQKIKLLELLTYLYEQDAAGVVGLLRCASLPATEASRIRVVENNVYSDLTIEDLAFLCNVSLSTFKRWFKEQYGDSPGRWLRRRRLEHAAEQITALGKKPAEVFYEAGYADYSSFSYSFKRQFGVSPRAYRRRENEPD